MHSILQSVEGYVFEDVEEIWNQCEGGLDFALDMIKKGKNSEEYLKEKRELIQIHAKEIKENPEMQLKLLNYLLSVNKLRPLGDVYYENEMVKEMVQRGLMQCHAGDSVMFRNKFVVRTLSDCLKAT